MGIPIGLFTTGELIFPQMQGLSGFKGSRTTVCALNAVAGARSALDGYTAQIDEKVVCDQWSLRKTSSIRDPRFAGESISPSGRRCYKMGPFWCSWDSTGANCCIVADMMEGQLRIVDLSGALRTTLQARVEQEEVTCVIVVRGGDEVVCGTSSGRLVHINLASGQVLQETKLSNNGIDYIWFDADMGFVALSAQDGMVYHFRLWAASMSISQYKLQLPLSGVTSASLSHDQQYLCLADDKQIHFYRWDSRSTPFRSVPVCQNYLDDDTIKRIDWDPNDRMVLVCTTARVVCYDSQDHWLSVVTRQPCDLVEWSPLAKLFLLGENRYGTLIHIFEHNNRGHWSSLGYTDIATKFGIRAVSQMAVTKSQLHLVHGDCYESFSME